MPHLENNVLGPGIFAALKYLCHFFFIHFTFIKNKQKKKLQLLLFGFCTCPHWITRIFWILYSPTLHVYRKSENMCVQTGEAFERAALLQLNYNQAYIIQNNDETVCPHYNCLIAVWERIHLLYWLVISAVPGLKALGLSDTCSSWVIRSPLVSDSVVTSRQCQGYTGGLSAYSRDRKMPLTASFPLKKIK